MAQPVWVLSVDLQTKTATFQTGLADAAKQARGTFTDIRSGANQMGTAVSYSMMESRHSVMLLAEEFGVHLPRALTSFIAGLGPVGPALTAAFPFLAVAVGATLLIQHLAELRKAGEQLTEDQVKFGTAVNTAFNTLDQKLLQSQIKADELRNDHLGALKLQLELIDKQSMSELVHQFEEVDKAAQVVMKDLEGHWYSIGIGSDGAIHALKQFGTQYESLLAQGKSQEASGLLAGTLKQAREVLAFQKEAKANDGGLFAAPSPNADISRAMYAENELRKSGVGYTEKEIAAQEQIVGVLEAQEQIEAKIAAIKKQDQGNAKTSEGNEAAARRSAAAREAAESMARMGESALAADKATSEASLAIHRASIEQRLAADLEFAARERDLKQAVNSAEIAALDKSGKDYANQLKALNDKAVEITAEYDAKVTELRSKSSEDANNRDLRLLEQSEREKIEATQEGSAARLAAIDAAIKQEEDRNLQDTNHYRELLNQRVETVRQAAEEEAKLKADTAREDANEQAKVGELTLAAARQHQQLLDSDRRISREQAIAEEQKFASGEYNIKLKAIQEDENALDKSGKDYLVKLKQLQDQEKELTQEHENELASIREKSEIEVNNRLSASYQQFVSSISNGLAQLITGHQSATKVIENLGDEMISCMVKNAAQYAMSNTFRQQSDAKAAGAAGYKLGLEIGGPAGMVLGPVFAATAFAGALAFRDGTDSVPGIGRGDIVPAKLEPGEGVVPGGVMDGLRKVARNGGFDQNRQTHLHRITFAPVIHAVDADGVDDILTKHQETFQRHFEANLRRMNR